jgi:hypothetical protein
MSIEFEPADELRSVTFAPPMDLNVTLDYQVHLINHCIEWAAALEERQMFKLIPRIENTIKRALIQIAHIQTQIKIETEIESNEEDTNEDTEGN